MTETQTTVEYCGVMHSTPFCPSCGKGLALDVPLVCLLRHVQKVAVKYEKEAAQLRTQRDDDAHKMLREEGRWLKQAEAGAAKWESWRVALSEVVSPALKDKKPAASDGDD